MPCMKATFPPVPILHCRSVTGGYCQVEVSRDGVTPCLSSVSIFSLICRNRSSELFAGVETRIEAITHTHANRLLDPRKIMDRLFGR